MNTKNIFLTKDATIDEMTKAMPKSVTTSRFTINGNTIEYNGNPKAFKFTIPKMVAVVESLDAELGFKVVRTPKTYITKDGAVKSTNVITFSFTDLEMAEILVDNVNRLCKSDYESFLASKGGNK